MRLSGHYVVGQEGGPNPEPPQTMIKIGSCVLTKQQQPKRRSGTLRPHQNEAEGDLPEGGSVVFFGKTSKQLLAAELRIEK